MKLALLLACCLLYLPITASAQVIYNAPVIRTSYYAPGPTDYFAPTNSYYAPATSYYAPRYSTPTTSYYAPTTSYAAPVPMSSFYAPTVIYPRTGYYTPTTSYYAPGYYPANVYRPYGRNAYRWGW